MSVIFVGGVPGSGKTLFTTYLLKRKYKKENRFHKIKINNCFSNYPVMLTNNFGKRKRYKKKVVGNDVQYTDINIYSRSCSIMDFNTYRKHLPDSVYVFDEFHTSWDSMDYKNFPKKIARTFQFHRHFGIKDIYVSAQHPARVVKKVRDLCDEFYKMKRLIKIPFIGIAFSKYVIYYNFDDYGKSTKVKKDDVIYDFKVKFCFFRYKKVFKSYDTKYMGRLVEDEAYFEPKPYGSLKLTLEDIYNNFGVKK